MWWGTKSGDGGFRWHHRGLIRGGKVPPHNRKWNMEAGSKKLPTRPPSWHPREPQPHQAPCTSHSMCMRENKAQLESVPKTAGEGPVTEGEGPVTGSQGLGGTNRPNERPPKKEKEKSTTPAAAPCNTRRNKHGQTVQRRTHQSTNQKMHIPMQCTGVSSGSGACSTQGTGWEQGRAAHTHT